MKHKKARHKKEQCLITVKLPSLLGTNRKFHLGMAVLEFELRRLCYNTQPHTHTHQCQQTHTCIRHRSQFTIIY